MNILSHIDLTAGEDADLVQWLSWEVRASVLPFCNTAKPLLLSLTDIYLTSIEAGDHPMESERIRFRSTSTPCPLLSFLHLALTSIA